MNKSIMKRYRILCLAFGVLIGCIFPLFAGLFTTVKSGTPGTLFVIACIAAGLVTGILSYTIGRLTVIRPLMELKKSFEIMSSGDFTNVCTIESSDSIGELVEYLDHMRISLRELIGVVRSKSFDIGSHVSIHAEELHKLSQEIEAVNQLAEIVQKDITEVSDNSKTLTETATEINAAIQSIADKASDGAAISTDISEKAGRAKTELEESVNRTEELFEATSGKLEAALQNIQAVDQIQVLLDTILQASSQTNKLALNANKEASHTENKEAGSSVIATEIRNLSKESRKNTEKITKVVNEVKIAVEELSTCSGNLLSFFSENVKADYEKFRGIVEEYDQNSQSIENIVADLSTASEGLSASLQVVTDRTSAISQLAANSTDQVNNIFQEVNKTNVESAHLAESTGVLKENAIELELLVKEFKLEGETVA